MPLRLGEGSSFRHLVRSLSCRLADVDGKDPILSSRALLFLRAPSTAFHMSGEQSCEIQPFYTGRDSSYWQE
jgi:hypothetical protein